MASGLPLTQRVSEWRALLREHRQLARTGYELDTLFLNLEEYDALLRRHPGMGLDEARVFEIGFGARPYRQMLLHSMGLRGGAESTRRSPCWTAGPPST